MTTDTERSAYTKALEMAANRLNRHYRLDALSTEDTVHVLLGKMEVMIEVALDDPVAFAEDNPDLLKFLYNLELQKKATV